jgi:hypothetical protein
MAYMSGLRPSVPHYAAVLGRWPRLVKSGPLALRALRLSKLDNHLRKMNRSRLYARVGCAIRWHVIRIGSGSPIAMREVDQRLALVKIEALPAEEERVDGPCSRP